MQEAALKTVTINTSIRAIRSYFNFLYHKKYIRKNPMVNIKLFLLETGMRINELVAIEVEIRLKEGAINI